ncbi:MAG: PASTA domain-containing protein [Spirochaetaceae bacterium]|nr:MAG: PASTA domain-containing protein [Spirochaetaceae bacterium]
MSGTSWAQLWTEKVFPNQKDPPERRNFKVVIILIVAMFLLMVLIGLVTFWLSVRGAEEVLVPNVEDKELIAALIELQEKELYPRLQVRYSSDFEKGMVIEQKPASGTIVRVGRRITLTVSRGPVIDRVEDYVGQKLEDVRIHLQTLFASYRALLKIKEPVSYVFDPQPAGTILAQKPDPGTVIDSVTELELVVSRGPRGELVEVPEFMEMDFRDAIAQLSNANFPFMFSVKRAEGEERPGVVVAQTPEAESEVPYGSVMQLTMTRPTRIPRGQVFGVFNYVLPDYPIMVDITLDSISEEGNSTILAMKHPGGPISIPYIVEEDSELVLYIFDQEEIRQQAGVGR